MTQKIMTTERKTELVKEWFELAVKYKESHTAESIDGMLEEIRKGGIKITKQFFKDNIEESLRYIFRGDYKEYISNLKFDKE